MDIFSAPADLLALLEARWRDPSDRITAGVLLDYVMEQEGCSRNKAKEHVKSLLLQLYGTWRLGQR